MLLELLLSIAAKPDALVIVLDDVGVTERPLLSSLDALASSGVEFTNAYAFPVCSIARYAALYGRMPRRVGMGNLVNAFTSATGSLQAPHSNVSMAEAFQGSHATGLFGKWHLGRASMGARVDLFAEVSESGPFVEGFDVWRAGTHNSIAQGPGATGFYDWVRVEDNLVTNNNSTYAVAAQRDACSAWWTVTPAPRFAWLALSGPHGPYDTPPGFTPAATTREQYENALTYADAAITSVLAAVDLSTTYVVVFGDNGTPDDARVAGAPSGVWKGTTYQGGVHVPLMVAGPGITPGTSSRLVSVMDIGPTLFELAGLTARGFDDGCSFADALGQWSGDAARTWLPVERYDVPGTDPSAPQPAGYDDIGIIEASWKLRRWDQDGTGPLGFQEALYFLPADPHELTPLDPALYPIASARLHAELVSLPQRL